MWSPDDSTRTVAIVGAGFCGTALAYRLLESGEWHGTVLLIEGTGRFGPGLAYGSVTDTALLNVPAGNMSIDEHRPSDFIDYLRAHGTDAQPHDFVPRRIYGQYLKDRLVTAARPGAGRPHLVRVTGTASYVTKRDSCFWIHVDDGRQLAAESVVVAVGHTRPEPMPALSALAGTSVYVNDPWSSLPACRPGGRVLVVGSGLTMADVVTELIARPAGPSKILAVSRHGLLPNERSSPICVPAPEVSDHLGPVDCHRLSRIVAAVRRAALDATASGGDWRAVLAVLRLRAPALWAALPTAERRRFLRHVQPYWDVHRHLLAPPVATALRDAQRSGRLELRAARVLGAEPRKHAARVTLRARGGTSVEEVDVDQVINCTGPLPNPAHNRSGFVRSLMASGLLMPDFTGCGAQVDAQYRLVNREGQPTDGLHYLGPWLRARDWEMTAVPELRRGATALATHLLSRASRAELRRPTIRSA